MAIELVSINCSILQVFFHTKFFSQSRKKGEFSSFLLLELTIFDWLIWRTRLNLDSFLF